MDGALKASCFTCTFLKLNISVGIVSYFFFFSFALIFTMFTGQMHHGVITCLFFSVLNSVPRMWEFTYF